MDPVVTGFHRDDIDNGDNVLVRFDEVKHETDGAFLIVVDEEEVWIPKSQVAHVDHAKGEMWLPLWLAESKGVGFE